MFALPKDRHPDPPVQSLPQLLGSGPEDMVPMVRVEMEVLNLVLSATPITLRPSPIANPGLGVDSGPLSREVGHPELAVADLRNDLVGNLIVVFFLINSNRLGEAGVFHCPSEKPHHR